jgi:hypothetical protein
VAGVVVVVGQHHGALGRPQHALQVGRLRGERIVQAGEQRIPLRRGMQVDAHRAHLAPDLVRADLAAQRMGDQLVAVADAEQRQAGVGGIAQPVGGALAPGMAVGNHRRRAGDDRAGEAFARRQVMPVLHIDHHGGVAIQPGGHADPVGKAAVPAHRGDGLAGFDDEEGHRGHRCCR